MRRFQQASFSGRLASGWGLCGIGPENGAIHPGDLLVTSATPGYAMKGTDSSRMLGAIIGKSLGAIESGDGVIDALITLQ
jgi:hypothetical protein